MMAWVDRQTALAIHDRQLAEHGGSLGVRDENLLESALARPRQLRAYGDPAPDIADLAASLAYGISRNHPFVDGNKRTAYVCCEAFLAFNGVELIAEIEDKYVMILALAEGKLAVEQFAAWLRRYSVVSGGKNLQESKARYKAGAKRSPPKRKKKK